ncbi:conserved hypothetical protein [Cryptococcus deneoformans JEC21]|uniref:Probable quinone oxidoreductase n=2 Tax=Cryptococcus deneoformans TaxID=40410 RepID=Q5KMM3_CRYD1|nr:conserved hypothetical protein [Cryptococcus neoformans var. neoformans JEC21]AAW41486.1 conserved hypothetical protein [Cryptococcus neoformans var. neoformans JEC21]
MSILTRLSSRVPYLAKQLSTMPSFQIPKTMKAIQVDAPGGPEVNVLREIPVPTPNPDEVLIKVQYTGVNYIDTYYRSGLYPKKFPYTVGQDAVGTLVQGPSSPDVKFDIPLGTTVFTPAGSSFAEYLVAPSSRVGVVPEGVDPKDGVSWSTVGLTALALAKESYPVKKGDWVLIRAAAGGVGLVLTQIVKYLGGHVIGTVSSQDKAELVKSYGADLVLLSTDPSEDNVKKILEVTNGGVHGVYDGVGKDTWEEDFLVVRRKGTIVTFGNASGAVPAFAPLKLTPKALKVTRPTVWSIVTTPEEFKEYTTELVDIVKKAGLKFEVYKVYELTQEGVVQAQKDITSRGTTGKLLIHVADK